MGPPTYRPFEFPYEEYRSGVGDPWPPATPPTHTLVSAAAQDDRIHEDSVGIFVKVFRVDFFILPRLIHRVGIRLFSTQQYRVFTFFLLLYVLQKWKHKTSNKS
jgi:hypothetical protein